MPEVREKIHSFTNFKQYTIYVVESIYIFLKLMYLNPMP